jgi:hypothetical protein
VNEFVRGGKPDLSMVISQTIPLYAIVINETLYQLDAYSHAGRVVITPLAQQ